MHFNICTEEYSITSYTYDFWYKDANTIYSKNFSPSAIEGDLLKESDFRMYPNPAKDKYKVQSLKFQVGRATLEIYDLNGRKLIEKQIPAGVDKYELDVSQLKNGIYFCTISTQDKSSSQKLIIQK